MSDEKDPPIIEGEFVEEVSSSAKSDTSKNAPKGKKTSSYSSSTHKKPNTQKPKTKGSDKENMKVVSAEKPSFLSRLPWILVGILVIFTTGLFAEPFAERSIRKFFPNLLPAPEAGLESPGLSEADKQTLTLVQGGLDGLTKRLAVVEQALNSLDDEAAVRDKQIETLTTAISTSSGSTADGASGQSNVPANLLQDVTDIKTTLQSLTNQLGAIEGRFLDIEGTTGQQATDLATLKTGLNALTTKQLDLETKLASSTEGTGASNEDLVSVMTTLNAINVRLQKLENSQSATTLSQGLAISAARLSSKALSGAAFADELLAIEVLIADGPALIRASLSPSLATLRIFAHKGYANLATLKEDLQHHAAEALNAAPKTPEERSWYSDALDGLSNLVSVRRTDAVEGNGNEARINRALLALRADDVVLAVTEIDQLTAPARTVYAPWLAMAGDRVAGQMALEAILNESLKPIRQPSDGSP